MFVIDRKIVTFSQYKKNGRLFIERNTIPKNVLKFAEKAIIMWDHCRAYVLDVCLSNGNPYVVEAQSFNSAGFYAANSNDIVNAANELFKV